MRTNRLLASNKTTQKTNYSLTSTARRLIGLYKELDAQTSVFKHSTGLSCESGCGRCCENPKVEATALEFIPLAVHLHKINKAQYWLKKTAGCYISGTCIFYQPKPNSPGYGSCLIYKYRPLVCRMFGFSISKDKFTKARLVTCPTIKKLLPEKYRDAQKHIEHRSLGPVMSDYSRRLYTIDFTSGVRQLPINKAVKEALEHVGLIWQYLQDTADII